MITATPTKRLSDCELGTWINLKGFAGNPLVLVHKDDQYGHLQRKIDDKKWVVLAALSHEVV